jgi:predicted nucleic acid-binding protein
MVSKIFIDSDVIIDFFTDREPFANPASELFDLNEQGKLELHISAVSINNIYYIVRKYLGQKKAMQVVEELVDIVQIAGTTKAEILQALRNGFKDFEDSIQYATALAVGDIEAIVTRNVKDYEKSDIAVFTPENYLKFIGDKQRFT